MPPPSRQTLALSHCIWVTVFPDQKRSNASLSLWRIRKSYTRVHELAQAFLDVKGPSFAAVLITGDLRCQAFVRKINSGSIGLWAEEKLDLGACPFLGVLEPGQKGTGHFPNEFRG